MKRFLNSYRKLFLALGAVCIWFWVPLVHAMGEVIVLAMEAFTVFIEASRVILPLIAASQINQHDMSSELGQALQRDQIVQQVAQQQAAIKPEFKSAIENPVRVMHDFAAAQKQLVATIPEAIAHAVEPSAQTVELSTQVINANEESNSVVVPKIIINGVLKPLIARHEAFMHQQFKESVKWYETQLVPGGMRIQPTDGNWHAQVTAGPRVDHTPLSIQTKAERQYCNQLFARALKDPEYALYIKNTVHHIESLLHQANSDDLATRIYARLALSEMQIAGPVLPIDGKLVEVPIPLQESFQYMLTETGKRWYSQDGQLISAEKTARMHDFTKHFISKSMHHVPELRGKLRYVGSNLDNVLNESGWKSFKQLWRSSHHEQGAHNKANGIVKKFIIACQDLDIGKADAVFSEYVQGMRKHHYSEELHQPLRQMLGDARVKYRAEQERIYNEHGIYRAFTNDPAYTQLSEKSLRDIAKHKVEKDALNHALLLRSRTKEAMKQAWHIECEAGSAVDQALYALLDRDISNPKLLVEAINDIVKVQTPETRQDVVNAFYAPNGVVKDFARWKTVKMISFADTLLKPGYDGIRHQLNQLLCLEHATLSANQTICLHHARAYIDHALQTDDMELRSAYLHLYDHMIGLAQADTGSLFIHMPCLASTFEHPAADLTQKCIAVTGASLVEIEKQLKQCGAGAFDMKTSERLAQELARQLDGLRRAHELNAEGSTNYANKVLADTFGKPNDGFIWPSDRPFVYAHHAVEKLRACIEDNPATAGIKCGTSDLIDVMSHGEVDLDDIRMKLDSIRATQPDTTTALYNEKESESEENAPPAGLNNPGDVDSQEAESKQEESDKNKPVTIAEEPLPLDNPSRMRHIFRNAFGHLLDTPENRDLLRSLVRDAKNFVGKDKDFLRDWYAKTLPNGDQLWAVVEKGKITNGGLNNIPKIWNDARGLCSPTPFGR